MDTVRCKLTCLGGRERSGRFHPIKKECSWHCSLFFPEKGQGKKCCTSLAGPSMGRGMQQLYCSPIPGNRVVWQQNSGSCWPSVCVSLNKARRETRGFSGPQTKGCVACKYTAAAARRHRLPCWGNHGPRLIIIIKRGDTTESMQQGLGMSCMV